MIKNAQRDYYSSQINESAGDQKKLFKVIDNLLHKSKIPVLPSSHSDESLATNLLTFFIRKLRTFGKLSMLLVLMFLPIVLHQIHLFRRHIR